MCYKNTRGQVRRRATGGSSEGRTTKKHFVSPFLSRKLEQCNDVESNPGPRTITTASSTASSTASGGNSSRAANTQKVVKGQSEMRQQERRQKETKGEAALEHDLSQLQNLLSSLDRSVVDLKSTIDEMRPAYNQALQILSNPSFGGGPQAGQRKNNLVFHGIQPDDLELQMAGEPEFCRDVLETRLKMVFREHLHISREMPLTMIYRVDANIGGGSGSNGQQQEGEKAAAKPLVVGFKSLKDKDNILRHSNLLRKQGIFITEDCSDKKSKTEMAAVPTTMPPVSPKKTKNVDVAKGSKVITTTKKNPVRLDSSSAALSDHRSSCFSDYAPSSHSSSSVCTD